MATKDPDKEESFFDGLEETVKAFGLTAGACTLPVAPFAVFHAAAAGGLCGVVYWAGKKAVKALTNG
jgi:hypothetical protein